ncbi:DUF1178 family protein [Rhodoferax sp.]|uniref:DUF1178 family protein n=1 Tax=Rhodoferax sp. TaxID=50421 RepID=UPI002638D2F3|nr:DUF1178 family protein [Rhodoferax sp.]MDD2923846.1 DUF1178 family protein [Rhodoferax sp.]
MKVLDLQCVHEHVFEGWFASEEDFLAQREASLIECPICGNQTISKRLSAPRLNFGNARETTPTEVGPQTLEARDAAAQMGKWLADARRVLAMTEDVGKEFVPEARKIHYGEAPERAIRGTATAADAAALIEEGIQVVTLDLPEVLKKTLQ